MNTCTDIDMYVRMCVCGCMHACIHENTLRNKSAICPQTAKNQTCKQSLDIAVYVY